MKIWEIEYKSRDKILQVRWLMDYNYMDRNGKMPRYILCSRAFAFEHDLTEGEQMPMGGDGWQYFTSSSGTGTMSGYYNTTGTSNTTANGTVITNPTTSHSYTMGTSPSTSSSNSFTITFPSVEVIIVKTLERLEYVLR